MNLETSPKGHTMRLKGTIIDDKGMPKPVIYTLAFLLDSEGAGDAYVFAHNKIEEYQNRTWFIHGYSDWNTRGEHTSPVKRFSTNMVGSIRDSIIQEMKLAIWFELQARGHDVYNVAVTLIKLDSPDVIVCALDGEVVAFKAEITFDPVLHRADCVTCMQGEALMLHDLERLKNSAVILCDREAKTHEMDNGETVTLDPVEAIYYAIGKIKGPTKLAGLLDWYKSINVGPMEMTHATDVVFVEV